jgi:hypothetical protein
MDLRRISRSEILAALGGALLAVSLFFPWYATSSNPNAKVSGLRGDITAWDAHNIIRYLFLAAALAPIVLLWVIVRDHQLSWPRGELTAVIGIVAFVGVVYLGIIDRPGEPPGEISISLGWFIALIGSLLISVGGSYRASTTERPRKPPGVL